MTKKIKRTFWEIFKRFFEPYFENKKIYLKGFFVAFWWGINGIMHIVFLEKIIHYLEFGNIDLFKKTLIFYTIYLLFYDLVNFGIKKWGWVELLGSTWCFLSKKYLEKYVKLDNNTVEKMGTGKLISIINSGVEEWGFGMWNIIEKGFSLIISVLFAVYMICKIDYFYGFIFFLLFLLFFLITIYFNKKLIPFRVKRNENYINISRNSVKILMNKNEILQTNKIKKENKNIAFLYQNEIKINKEMGTFRFFLKRNSKIGISLILLFSYYILGFQFLEGKIELSLLVGLSSALIIIEKSISESLTFYIDFTKQFIKIEKLWDFFDSTPEIKGYETGEDFKYLKGNIELKNINYGYISNKKIFDNFNLKIIGGKITALVGLSGSGKSTLVKLISGYIRADSGKILIDNQNLNDFSLKTYYKNIGYLTQEPSVFDGTILENLTYAISGKIEKEKLNKIIKLAKCEFIYDLQNGINTEIGERGVRLSGGERQRLAIAKIFLKNPQIIILDEPTSALDSFSEELITKAMHNLFENRTVIIIAHRLQTVKNANEIILIEDGKIKERGNHKDLVEKNGIYNKMLELQSGF